MIYLCEEFVVEPGVIYPPSENPDPVNYFILFAKPTLQRLFSPTLKGLVESFFPAVGRGRYI